MGSFYRDKDSGQISPCLLNLWNGCQCVDRSLSVQKWVLRLNSDTETGDMYNGRGLWCTGSTDAEYYSEGENGPRLGRVVDTDLKIQK